MNTKILDDLGKQIKYLRKENHLTQAELAKKVGVHPTYIGKIESGKNNISTIMLFKISKVLKVTLPKLFEFDN